MAQVKLERQANGLPRGPLTAKQKAERLEFAVQTFSNCPHREAQIEAIMGHMGIQRQQATRILDQAAKFLQTELTEYQKNFVRDTYAFLQGIKTNPLHPIQARMQAQSQLTSLLHEKKQKIVIEGVQPVFVSQINLAILNNPDALEKALQLEESLAEGDASLYASPSGANSEQGAMDTCPPSAEIE